MITREEYKAMDYIIMVYVNDAMTPDEFQSEYGWTPKYEIIDSLKDRGLIVWGRDPGITPEGYEEMDAYEMHNSPTTEGKKMKHKKINLLSLYERAGKAGGDMFTKEFDYSPEERRAFMEAIRNYERYGQVIYGSKQLVDAVKEISELVELANGFTLKETDGWFDNVTTTRHTKQMKEALKVLQKEAQEIVSRQQRLEAAYEDIGQLLGRYYDV